MPAYQYPVGPALQDMSFLASGQGYTSQYNIVAHAGGLQPSATPITGGTCWVETVATIGDSVALPSAVGGQYLTVINNTANSLNVFSSPATTADTINGTAGTTAYAIAGGKVVNFASKPGAWRALLSA